MPVARTHPELQASISEVMERHGGDTIARASGLSRSFLYSFRANGRATDRTVAKLAAVVHHYERREPDAQIVQTGIISDSDVAAFLRVMEHLLARVRREALESSKPKRRVR